MITIGENILRAARFERPAYIPMTFHINPACWDHYPHQAIYELMAAHPLLFPDFDPASPPPRPKPRPFRRAGERYVDPWGCVWVTEMTGTTGAVVEHPLADWAALEGYQPPDPATSDGWEERDWDQVRRRLQEARAAGRLVSGSLRHGHTFLTLTYIRGYENAIYDMQDDEPRLHTLLDMIEAFNQETVRRFLECGVEWMGYPEDLGMQVGPMLSLAHFRRYIKPIYQRLVAPAAQAGCVIHMHSDGDIRALVEDLMDTGMQVLNLQDLVNGLDWIVATLKGRVCIDLDIDRQRITPFGTPAQIDDLIRRAVSQVGSPQGGLMMIYGWYPGVPLENARAVMDAMERYATYFS